MSETGNKGITEVTEKTSTGSFPKDAEKASAASFPEEAQKACNPNGVRKSIFLMGMRDGLPIGFGYFAVAFSLGIIAKKAGLTALTGFFSSLTIRASAGEYGAYTLIAAGAAFSEVALMAVITNLRYLLMGASLSQKFSPQTSLLKRILVACCITDEIFGISIAYKGYLAPVYTFGATAIGATMWASGCMCGIIAGGTLSAGIVSALSVALYGMFIAIIIPPARQDRAVLVAVIVSFILSWVFSNIEWTSVHVSSGMRTIILTIFIAAAMAIIKPIKE